VLQFFASGGACCAARPIANRDNAMPQVAHADR